MRVSTFILGWTIPLMLLFFGSLIEDGYYELEVQQKLHDFKKNRFSENSNSIWVWNNIRLSEILSKFKSVGELLLYDWTICVL